MHIPRTAIEIKPIVLAALLMFTAPFAYGQNHLPIVHASSKTASIRDGKHFKKDYWAIMPERKPDLYYTEIPGQPHKVTFITDRDSISFDVSYGKDYDFIVLLNGKDSCFTRISATYKKLLPLSRIRNSHGPDTIPFTVSDRHKIHVSAKLNGSEELTVEVDLGAGGTVINKNHLEKVKIDFDGKINLANADGVNEVQSSSKNLLQIGDLTWDSVQVAVAGNMKEYEDLIVGNYLFKDKVLELNYDKNIMIVHDTLPAMAANYTRHDVLLDYGVIPLLFVKLKVGEKEKEGWVMFDTGAQSTILSSGDVGKADGIFFEAAEMLGLNKSKRPTLTVNDQEFTGFQYRTRDMRSEGLSMILGNSLLKRFNTILDNRNGYIYLQPNSLQDAPYERNDGYYIVRVLAGLLMLLLAFLVYRKNTWISIVVATVPFAACQGPQSGSGEPSNRTYTVEELRTELEAINGDIARYVVLEQTDSLVAHYAADFAYMPEFKPAIGDAVSLTDFYNQWFGVVANNQYQKKIYLVEAYGDHVLEIGDFALGYASGQGQERRYNGNYFILWQRDERGQLKIRSEIFGANTYLTARDVPYADVIVADAEVLRTARVSEALRPELEVYDNALVTSIEQGDGRARATGFHPEGLYVPHFSLRLEGMDALLPYLTGIYRPEAKLYTRNTHQEVFNLGEVVFLTGHFTGGWGDAATGGTFRGNMASLLKRDESGKLLMYRQMVNNDR